MSFLGKYVLCLKVSWALLGIKISTGIICLILFVCLFDLILYVPSTIFQLSRDGSSGVEPVLSSRSKTTTQ